MTDQQESFEEEQRKGEGRIRGNRRKTSSEEKRGLRVREEQLYSEYDRLKERKERGKKTT